MSFRKILFALFFLSMDQFFANARLVQCLPFQLQSVASILVPTKVYCLVSVKILLRVVTWPEIKLVTTSSKFWHSYCFFWQVTPIAQRPRKFICSFLVAVGIYYWNTVTMKLIFIGFVSITYLFHLVIIIFTVINFIVPYLQQLRQTVH